MLRHQLYESQVKAAKLEGQVDIMAQMNALNKDNASNAMGILYDKVKNQKGGSSLDKGGKPK